MKTILTVDNLTLDVENKKDFTPIKKYKKISTPVWVIVLLILVFWPIALVCLIVRDTFYVIDIKGVEYKVDETNYEILQGSWEKYNE